MAPFLALMDGDGLCVLGRCRSRVPGLSLARPAAVISPILGASTFPESSMLLSKFGKTRSALRNVLLSQQ